MNFSTLSVVREDALLRVSINNAPINLMNIQMVQELFQLTGLLQTDPSIKVVLFDSAVHDFFIAHFDLDEFVKSASDPSAASKYDDINVLQSLALSFRNVPQVTIAKINGCVRGGGLEFALGLTMRFSTTTSKFALPEASVGFMACGGGATSIALAVGPARAMEILLSARDFSGEEAERYGLINRALPEDQLDDYVNDLVERILLRSPEVIGMHNAVFKKVFAGIVEPMFDALAEENVGMRSAMEGSELQAGIAHHLSLGQTREVEMDLPGMLHKYNKAQRK